jgi:hypothetical protein
MPNLEMLFNEGTGRLEENEIRIYQMWQLVKKGFKPWEIDADYEDNERIVKPEDKHDLLKLDQFETNAINNARKRKEGLDGFGLGSPTAPGQRSQKQDLFSARPKRDLVFE